MIKPTDKPADVVIIGLGAAGGVAAHVLTRAGLEVVGLEAGPRLDGSMMSQDEIRNDVESWLSEPKSMWEIPSWRTGPAEATRPSPRSVRMVNGVGGTSVHYHGASLRFQPWQFESRSRTVERYGLSAVPPNSTLTDWPLTYEDLEPYYDATEYAIGVAGQAGNLGGRIIEGGNPFEGPRSRDYPMPPLRPSGWNDLMDEAARNLGWHPFPIPCAINSVPYNGNPTCTYCGFCSSNGCHNGSRGSTDVTLIRRAEATGRLRVETMARVVRLETGGDGRVSGVTYVQDGRERFQPARVVLLATFLYENVRLLLLSGSAQFPDGLSNNHGQVGKHYMAHISARVYGTFPGRRLNRFNGSGGQTVCVEDWEDDNFDHSGLGFMGGVQLITQQELKPIDVAALELPPGVPRWGSRWKAWMHANAQSIGHVNGMFADLPYEGNLVDLDPSVKDRFGLPVTRVTHAVYENERRGWEFAVDKARRWLEAAGADLTWPRSFRVEPRHPYGGTRMGDDPATSVVDRYGFSHEVPNLGVLGASVFPSTSADNPTLTLQAVAWWSAQHLVDNWDVRAAGRLE